MSDLLIKMPLEYEPLKENRFLVRFPSDLGIQEWWVETAGSPGITINATDINFLNTKTTVAGKYSWDEISIQFRSPIGPSASQALMEWVRLCAESVTGRMGYAVAYKRDLVIELLDPTGVAVNQWILKNCWMKSTKGSGLTYGSDGLYKYDCSIVYDYAILSY